MIPTPLPFDYVKKVDPGDRLRRARKRSNEARVRRPEPRESW
jgi:hypothetical protein